MSDLTTTQIREFINEIKIFKNSSFMQELKLCDNKKYFNILNTTFANFKLNYESMFNVIVNEDNIDNLYLMLDMKDKIDNGSNKKEIEKEIAQKLANEFLPVSKK